MYLQTKMASKMQANTKYLSWFTKKRKPTNQGPRAFKQLDDIDFINLETAKIFDCHSAIHSDMKIRARDSLILWYHLVVWEVSV